MSFVYHSSICPSSICALYAPPTYGLPLAQPLLCRIRGGEISKKSLNFDQVPKIRLIIKARKISLNYDSIIYKLEH